MKVFKRNIHLFSKNIYDKNQSNEIITQLISFQSNIQKRKDNLVKIALDNNPYYLLQKKLNNPNNKKKIIDLSKRAFKSKVSSRPRYLLSNKRINILFSSQNKYSSNETEDNKTDKLCSISQAFSQTKPKFNKSLYSFTKPIMTETASFTHFHPMTTAYNSSMNFLPCSRKLNKLIDINRQTYTDSMKIKQEIGLVKEFKRKKKFKPITAVDYAVGKDVLNLIKDEALEIKQKKRSRNTFYSQDELQIKNIMTQSNQISKISPEDIFKLRQSLGDQMGLNVLMNENIFVFEKKYKINDKYVTPMHTRFIIDNQKTKNKIVKDLVHKIVWESHHVE